MIAKEIVWCIWNYWLDRLAQRQSIPLSTEAQQEHVNILFFKISYIFIKKDRDWTILGLYYTQTSVLTQEPAVVI